MKDSTWKTLAIIFMCLFLIETIFFVWSFNLGTEMIENENECAINICDVGNTNDAYSYDAYDKICYCYRGNEVSYQKYMT